MNFNPDNLWFTADTHYGHGLPIEKGMRSFPDVDAMDEYLIRMHNETVSPNGIVVHAGDLSFRKNWQTYEILKRLNGELHLVRGNHDKGLNTAILSCFQTVEWRLELSVERQKIIVSHEPKASWAAVQHGAWHLHGHSHGSSPLLGRRYDVGVDCNALRPVSFRQLQIILGSRPIACGDGHIGAMEGRNGAV